MAWRVRADPLRFEEAEAFLREKVPLSQSEYRALSLQAAQRAFTVAGVAQLELISETLRSLQRAVEDGTPYEDWVKAIGPRLEAAWGSPRPWRLELIFRQSVLGAYAAGRYAQQTDPEVLAARPFWLYDAVLDAGTTPVCRGYNGTLLPASHPWWRSRYPPNHFGCRSGVRSLTRREAEGRGVSEAPPEILPPAAFRAAPDEPFSPDPARYSEEMWRLWQQKVRSTRVDERTRRWYGRPEFALEGDTEALQAVLNGHAAEISDLTGRALTLRDLALLTGAPGGSRIDFRYVEEEPDKLTIGVWAYHPEIQHMRRAVVFDFDRGEAYTLNKLFRAANPGNGFGARAFAHQVKKSAELGLRYLLTEAARGTGWNGYYTWPLLGYDAPLSDRYARTLAADYAARYGGPTPRLRSLLDLPGGAEFWQEVGDSVEVEFDLEEGSRSRTVLRAYLEARGILVSEDW